MATCAELCYPTAVRRERQLQKYKPLNHRYGKGIVQKL